jgi:hypothetical protein
MKKSQREGKEVGSARRSFVSPLVAMVLGRDARRGYLGKWIEREEEGVGRRSGCVASVGTVKVVVVDNQRYLGC